MADLREASLAHDSRGLPGGWLLQSVPFVILACGAAWLLSHWRELPERVPIHWNWRGEADRWVARGPLAVLAPLLIGACVCWLLLVLGVAIRRSSPRGRLRRPMLWTLLGAELFAALTCCALILPMATGGRLLVPTLLGVLAGALALVSGVCVAIECIGREPVRNPAGWHRFFYFDREDPALFVPKRSGVGYTLNAGHPAAVPFSLLIVFFGLAIVAILVVLR